MLIRLSRWGMALLAISSLAPLTQVEAQDSTEPAAPPAVRSKEDLQDYIEDRSIRTRNKPPRERKVHDADPWKKHPPAWSIPDVTKDTHPYAHPSAPAPGGGHFPGGPTGQFGRPYYYTATAPDTSGTGGGVAPGIGGAQPIGGYGQGGYGAPYGGGGSYGVPYGGVGQFPSAGGYPSTIKGILAAQDQANLAYGGGYGGGYGAEFDMSGASAAPVYGYGAPGPVASGYPIQGHGGPGYGAPGYGGYGAGIGNGHGPAANGASYAAMPGQLPGDPYYYHFGPGFYRQQEAGHYTFPYNSYRRPWYFPGHTSYNRDTNIPW